VVESVEYEKRRPVQVQDLEAINEVDLIEMTDVFGPEMTQH
jgi:hypothetical protein